MTWIKNLVEWLVAILSVLDRVFDSAGDLLSGLWDDFPNPIKMVNHILTFMTRLPGHVVAGFALGYFDQAAIAFDKPNVRKPDPEFGLPWQHVMTPGNAIRFAASLIEESLRFLTLSRDQSIVETLFTAFGRWAFRLLKNFNLIKKILGLQTEADFIKLFMSMKAARVGTIVLYACVAALVFIVILSTATTGMLLFGGTILKPRSWEEFTLFSQNKRKKEQTRISRRVGGVRP